jgi:hypothetical protein
MAACAILVHWSREKDSADLMAAALELRRLDKQLCTRQMTVTKPSTKQTLGMRLKEEGRLGQVYERAWLTW